MGFIAMKLFLHSRRASQILSSQAFHGHCATQVYVNLTQAKVLWEAGTLIKKMLPIKDFLKFNENEHTAYPDLWSTMKAGFRGKFIALNAYIKKLEKSHTIELTEYLKTLEKEETNSPRRTRQ